jgi:hypothetical protein
MSAGDVAWEVTKGIGSFAGFFSTIYILYDRIWKHMPTAVLVPRPIMSGSKQITTFLKITNFASRPILVAWENGRRDELGLSRDDSIDGIVSSLFPGETVIAIDATETRELTVLKPSNYRDLEPDAPLVLTMRWKFAQPILWQPSRKLRIWIRKSDFMSLTGAKDEELD